MKAPCKGTNCGSTNGWWHSRECFAEHDALTTPTASQAAGEPVAHTCVSGDRDDKGNVCPACAAPVAPRAGEEAVASAPQAVGEPVAQPVKAVAEFNNGSWRLRLGSVWMTAPNPPVGPQMVNEEYKVKMYAARINAEIAGGVAAFGCDVEARGTKYRDGDKVSRCLNWCGLERCAVSLKSAPVAPRAGEEVAHALGEYNKAVRFLQACQKDEAERNGDPDFEPPFPADWLTCAVMIAYMRGRLHGGIKERSRATHLTPAKGEPQ